MKKLPLILSKASLTANSLAAAEITADFCAAVLDANRRPGRFVYTSGEIQQLALSCERRLARSGLPQAQRVGIEFVAEHAGPAAKAYKFRAMGRRVTMRRTAKGWVLVAVDDIVVYPTQPERTYFRATAGQIEEIRQRAVSDIIVRPEAA